MPPAPLYLRTGPFVTRVETSSALVLDGIHRLYDAPCLLEAGPSFCDFHVTVGSPFLRRWLRPKVEFLFEGAPVFKPSPPGHALPLFEWGLNWVIATQMNQYLAIHAAVVERGGRAMLLPGEPGAGKSTLCAGLVYRGWRLLSDELALIVPATRELVALARPISLKNESIAVMRRFAPDAVQSEPAIGTIKGTIVLSRPPADSFARVDEPARPGWIVFPSYQAGAPADLRARPKSECFIELAANALNYSTLGAQGFETLGEIVGRSGCFEFAYGDLEEGVRRLTDLADAA
jgi:HprK-related kinase A